MSLKSQMLAPSKSITLASGVKEAQGAFSKWDMLHMESRKRLDKTDSDYDDVLIGREPEEYTF